MDKYTDHEQAYKNGVEDGKKLMGLKWHLASERMPEDFVSVLVHIPDDAPLPTVKEAYHAGGLWITRCCMYNNADIARWAPMPEPPKEE